MSESVLGKDLVQKIWADFVCRMTSVSYLLCTIFHLKVHSGEKGQAAVDALRVVYVLLSVFDVIDYDRPFEIRTNGCNKLLGCLPESGDDKGMHLYTALDC